MWITFQVGKTYSKNEQKNHGNDDDDNDDDDKLFLWYGFQSPNLYIYIKQHISYKHLFSAYNI